MPTPPAASFLAVNAMAAAVELSMRLQAMLHEETSARDPGIFRSQSNTVAKTDFGVCVIILPSSSLVLAEIVLWLNLLRCGPICRVLYSHVR